MPPIRHGLRNRSRGVQEADSPRPGTEHAAKERYKRGHPKDNIRRNAVTCKGVVFRCVSLTRQCAPTSVPRYSVGRHWGAVRPILATKVTCRRHDSGSHDSGRARGRRLGRAGRVQRERARPAGDRNASGTASMALPTRTRSSLSTTARLTARPSSFSRTRTSGSSASPRTVGRVQRAKPGRSPRAGAPSSGPT
jgi:hypothetical protein